ncbi:MAG: hypothetical protein ABW061_23635 [Polyangiaceae bacterium]
MSRSGDLFADNEAIVAAAVVASQATLGNDGFRQRDVRFYISVFSNWLEATTGVWTLDLHNAQVQRYLDLLVKTGWAKRPGRKPPRYCLTPEGLLRLLERIGQRKNLKRFDEFFFILHVFHAYGDRLRGLVQQTGPFNSKSLSVDLDELLDFRRLIARERALVQRESLRLSVRIQESRATSELTRSLLSQGRSLEDAVRAVEQQFPYEMNSQKPLGELFAQLPAPFRRVELETIAELRASTLWEPTRALLQSYLGILDSLDVPPAPAPAQKATARTRSVAKR